MLPTLNVNPGETCSKQRQHYVRVQGASQEARILRLLAEAMEPSGLPFAQETDALKYVPSFRTAPRPRFRIASPS